MIDTSGAAFPTVQAVTYVGLTKRELFAGLAMQAMTGNSQLLVSMADRFPQGNDHTGIIAKAAIELADALLAELAKETTK